MGYQLAGMLTRIVMYARNKPFPPTYDETVILIHSKDIVYLYINRYHGCINIAQQSTTIMPCMRSFYVDGMTHAY
jgi:hypothetical protein